MPKIFDLPPQPLEGPPAPTLRPGQRHGPCPKCGAKLWTERPDGTAVCHHCVMHAGTHGPNSNGDYRWCKTCNDDYWKQFEAHQKRVAHARRG